MCQIHNTIGSLTTIRSRLDDDNIYDFKSLQDLIDFLTTYESARQQIIDEHTKKFENEKTTLKIKIQEIEASFLKTKDEVQNQRKIRLNELNTCINELPETNSKIIPTIIDYCKNFAIWIKIWSTQLAFHYKLKTLDKLLKNLAILEKERLDYLNMDFDAAVAQSCSPELNFLNLKKCAIEEIQNSIYGAFGEYKVVKALETLSDEFILINDFNHQFHPAIYNRKENDYIKSIQVDHILVSRAGIFIIETKNWSEKSILNLNFYSPVKQIKRANYALYIMLSDAISRLTLRLNNHHWGDRKIPFRNLIVLINKRPMEEFQFVKILTLSELTSYIKYFPPIFSFEETQSIADYSIRQSDNKQPSNQIDVYDSFYRQ